MMMKPKKTIASRYRREEKQARASEIGSHNSVPTPRRRNSFEELRTLKAANQDLTNENNKLQSELAERRTINEELMTSIKSHETKITELNKTAEHLQKKLDEAKNNNALVSELFHLNKEKMNRSSNVKTVKLIRLVTLLRRRLRHLKGQKETGEKLLQEIRQKCKHIFNSQFHPDFLQANSNLITSVVELYESHSHSDRINFCPAIQYMKIVPKVITSSGIIKNVASDSATTSKRRKIDNSTQDIEKCYSHKSLKALVMNSEKRHSDNYQQHDSNTVIIPDEDPDDIRSDVELVKALFSANPSMKTRYCYSANTIYYCSPSTNLWSKLSETEFESHLRKYLTSTLRLNKAELKYIDMTNTIVKVRNISLCKIENIAFSEIIDGNLNLFQTLNKTVDAKRFPAHIRNIEKDDMAETTCGWSYDCQLSEKHMEAVWSYFDKLFPQKSEREWFLSFVANSLRGGSTCFLVLTDNYENKNVTSNLISLLATVFGNYYIDGNKIVVSGGRDYNHLGEKYNLNGKRLLVANKLQRADVLNTAFIKALTGSLCYFRYIDKISRAHVKYSLDAGLIMTFTEDDVPQFDKNDQAFFKRMAVIPMRSQFVSKNEYDELVKKGKDMTHIYIADDTPDFQEWSSAVLDLLIENYRDTYHVIPNSMVNSNKKLCLNSRNYDYYEWLDSNLCADEDKQAFVSLTQIVTQIKKTHEFNRRQTNTLRLDMSKWAKSNDFQYKNSHAYVSNKRKLTCKTVIMGVSFCYT